MRDYEYHLIQEVREGRMTRRELLRRASLAGLSLPLISALLAACGGGSTPPTAAGATAPGGSATASPTTGARRGGTGRFGTTTPAADVDPVTMFNQGAIVTTQMAGEYLCLPREDYSLEPRLATEWKAEKPDQWLFTIREGVKWQDGSPLTTDDVVATFERLTDPEVKSAALSTFKGILSHGNTEKVGANQVRFNLDRPFVDFPTLVSAFNYNAIILPKNYEVGQFIKGGVGTGPFILKSYTPKVGASFVRNPNYWNTGRPYLDAAELKYYADNPPEVLALQAGEIDVFVDVPFQGSQALFNNPDISIFETRTSGYRELHMRVDKKPFDDKRVRQAVALCLDRPALVQGLFNGKAEVGNDHAFAPIYPVSADVASQAPQRAQNYDEAKRLLAAAGHANGLDVTLTTEQFLEVPQYAVFVRDQLKPAGIRVKLNILDQGAYYGSGDNQPWLEVPMGITDWAARGSASQTITPAYLCDGVWNSAHWCNKEYDKLIAQLDSEVDEGKRRQIAAQAAKIQQDETPAVIAYWVKGLRAVRKNVRGIGPIPNIRLDEVWLS